MLGLDFSGSRPLHILCLGAHCDDIEIGCGGTILRLLQEKREIAVTWVTFCSTPHRKLEAERSAAAFLRTAADSRVMIHAFRDGFLPWLGAEVKEEFEKLKSLPAPDILFTHGRDDAHQDHRLVAELTWNTFRNHLIFEYEIPKYDGDLGRPGVYVPLDESTCRKKIDLIREGYPSQSQKGWFTEDIFRSLLRLRGMEANAPSGHAEAFHCRKLVIFS